MTDLTPLPGDPAALQTQANGLASAAEQIQQAINQLRKLADIDSTVSKAIDSVRSDASSVADNITKAQVRYAGTASALQEYAPKLEAAQQRATRAINAYNGAQQQASTAQSNLQQQQEQYKQQLANAPTPAPGAEPPKSFGNTPAGSQANQAVTDANDAVSSAMGEYNAAISDVDTAAQAAISQIKKAISESHLNDSWWDSFTHALSDMWNDAVAWAKKYLAPVLDVIQKIAAAIADIGGYLSMVLNILAVFIPVLAPFAAAVDLIVLAAAAISFIATAALVVLGDRTLGDLLNTGITLVMSALPIKEGGEALKGVKGLEGFSKVSEKLLSGEGALSKTFGLVEKAGGVLNKYSGLEKLSNKLPELVGKGGEALGSRFGSKFTGTAEYISSGENALKAYTGSLAHGTGWEQAAANAGRQAATGSVEGFAKVSGSLATAMTKAGISTFAGSVNNNVSALTDRMVMPHLPYFQYHSGLDIQSLSPNIQVVSSPTGESSTTFGGLNPVNDFKAMNDLMTNAPTELGRALVGTAVLK